jgi:peptidoglycan/xylan/chitin deacetylase (PgdA/CDA1 family)
MWPKSSACAVVLTFNLDAESLWTGTVRVHTPAPLSRGRYGAIVGVPRILKMLEKYDLKATFFVSGNAAETYPEIVKEIYNKGHEIGHHGYMHESPVRLNPEEEKAVLEKGRNILVNITGEKPRGYRSPAWDHSPNTVRLLKEHGMIYDSSLMADEKPYEIEINSMQTILELPVDYVLDYAPYFLFTFFPSYLAGTSDPSKVYEIWKSEFDGYYREGGCFILTMHPQIIGRFSRMAILEKLLQYIQSKPHIWFARCIDVANYWLHEVMS